MNHPSNCLRLRFVALTFAFLLSAFAGFAQDGDPLAEANQEEGKKIYEQVCKACHALSAKRGTGPGFYGVFERWESDIEDMVYMIRNGAKKYIDDGRPRADYIQGLVDDYGSYMPAQNVSDAEAVNTLAYIKNNMVAETAGGGGAAAADAGADTGGMAAVDADTIYGGLTVLIAVLGIAIIALILIIAVIVGTLRSREKGQEYNLREALNNLGNTLKNGYVAGGVVLLVVLIAFSGLYNVARDVGLHEGYQPVQPVAFKHDLHAGKYEIDCQYCHVGVEKGKSATIPSTNICTNCHHKQGGILQGPEYGEAEIAKVIASAENNQPIEWVRIHNLPDLVYFNHSQHVKVGGLECQECHGPIEEMKEVYQYSLLSMGWCLNCHREREVDLTKSDYYKFHHGAYLGSEEKVKVKDLGGLDCASCHY